MENIDTMEYKFFCFPADIQPAAVRTYPELRIWLLQGCRCHIS